MAELTTAEEISDIAFGFMGSKALFAALHHDVFTALEGRPANAEEVGEHAGLHAERARTLLTALASLGLVSVDEGRFANAPAASAFLVKGAKYDFGDYLRFQVDRQMYGLLDQLSDALADRLGEDATASYEEWFSDPAEARLYSDSQHAGSLGPARGLAKSVDLSDARHLLDVGGGTGAFAITLCKAFPDLSVTVIDFPNVAAIGREHVAAAGLSHRITYKDGNALVAPWPRPVDGILMSYLFSGIPGDTHGDLLARAFDHLSADGRLMIHDFVVSGARDGPKLAALWQLQHTAFTPKARSLDDAWLKDALEVAGFEDVSVAPMIQGLTMLAEARKPGRA